MIDIEESIFPKTKLKVEICGSFLLTDENGDKELKLIGVFNKNHKINKNGITKVKDYIKFCKGEEKALKRKVSKFYDKEKTSEFFKDYVLIKNAALIKTYNGHTIPCFQDQIIINKKDIKYLETTWEKGNEYFGSLIKEGLINYDGCEFIIKKGIIYMF